MRSILALDQGTTSSRAILFAEDREIRATAQREFEQRFPQPGWVEHDPVEIWRSQAETAAEAGRAADTGPDAVGITNQRETVVVWDRATGEPIHPAVVWQDRRGAPACARLAEAGAADFVRARTGLVLDPYFSGTKAAWILDHVDGARARAERGELAFGTIDTWLVWRLTEGRVHATDPSNASRTMLFDIAAGDWDDELLELLRVPRAILPDVVPSSGVLGEVSAIDELRGVPIAGLAGDQHAALFGQGCHRPGLAKNTYGTGCFLLMHTGTQPVPSNEGLLTTVAWRVGDHTEYALEGSVFIGGAAVQWLRDGLGIIQRAAEVEALAASVESSGGVVFVPAFAGLGAPHWDASARGSITGLTRGSTRAHLARAALEAIAFQSADVLEAMQRDTGTPLTELRVDGGACANDLLMQIQADIVQRRIVRPAMIESTALGAAALAGLAVGLWPDRSVLADSQRIDRAFEPGPARPADRAAWDRAVAATRMAAQCD